MCLELPFTIPLISGVLSELEGIVLSSVKDVVLSVFKGSAIKDGVLSSIKDGVLSSYKDGVLSSNSDVVDFLSLLEDFTVVSCLKIFFLLNKVLQIFLNI